jgi:hypothetical protein
MKKGIPMLECAGTTVGQPILCIKENWYECRLTHHLRQQWWIDNPPRKKIKPASKVTPIFDPV